MLLQTVGCSERRACRAMGFARSVVRYRLRRGHDEALRSRLRELSARRVRFGYRRLLDRLQKEGMVVNHKRVYRLYRDEGLTLRRRTRRRRAASSRAPRVRAERVNQRWAIDFIEDSLADGRTFRMVCILDEVSRECVGIEASHSLPAARVIRLLERIALTRGLPEELVSDNGPEFRSHALDVWATQHGVRLEFTRPATPTDNPFLESFHGKFRDECLNLHWFADLAGAQRVLEAWRVDYNTERPHSSLGYATPAEFAKRARLRALEGRSAARAHPRAPEDNNLHPEELS